MAYPTPHIDRPLSIEYERASHQARDGEPCPFRSMPESYMLEHILTERVCRPRHTRGSCRSCCPSSYTRTRNARARVAAGCHNRVAVGLDWVAMDPGYPGAPGYPGLEAGTPVGVGRRKH